MGTRQKAARAATSARRTGGSGVERSGVEWSGVEWSGEEHSTLGAKGRCLLPRSLPDNTPDTLPSPNVRKASAGVLAYSPRRNKARKLNAAQSALGGRHQQVVNGDVAVHNAVLVQVRYSIQDLLHVAEGTHSRTAETTRHRK
jgi:hypothetical protein